MLNVVQMQILFTGAWFVVESCMIPPNDLSVRNAFIVAKKILLTSFAWMVTMYGMNTTEKVHWRLLSKSALTRI